MPLTSIHKMLQKLYINRFELFFFSQITILFGSLIFTPQLFDAVLSPILFQINVLTGILLISHNRKLMWFFVGLLAITSIVLGSSLIDGNEGKTFKFIRIATYFLFYVVVTFQIIKQVWQAKNVNKNVIFGLVSGYVSLGLIGFFICISIEMGHPESFHGILTKGAQSITEGLMYFSYVTLLTIGYGDVYPATPLAHKAAILIGLMGQIYLVVITAIVVGKYINQNASEDKN